MSIRHNKKHIFVFNLLINFISARSAPQIFSIEGDCAFLLWNFLRSGLCNSFTNSLLEIVSFLIPLLGNPKIFYQKKVIDY